MKKSTDSINNLEKQGTNIGTKDGFKVFEQIDLENNSSKHLDSDQQLSLYDEDISVSSNGVNNDAQLKPQASVRIPLNVIKRNSSISHGAQGTAALQNQLTSSPDTAKKKSLTKFTSF